MIAKKSFFKKVLWVPYFNEGGATFVEFSVVGLIVFALVGAGIDFGLGLWKYSNLTHAMNVAVRNIAIDLASSSGAETCTNLAKNEVNPAARDMAKKLLLKGDFVLGKNLTAEPPPDGNISIVSVITTAPPTLSITSQMKLQCMFCIYFRKGLILSTTSQAMIENSTFTCT